MLRVSNLPLSLDAPDEAALGAALKKLRVPREQVLRWHIAKKSVDARDKGDVRFVVAVDVAVQDETQVLSRLKPGVAAPVKEDAPLIVKKRPRPAHPPVVVGLGPGGLFAALYLARAGMCPIVLERGENVDKRAQTVAQFERFRVLNPDSNIQFGEGGAGAFSDGKLTTGIKDPRCRVVLNELYAHGAPRDILTLARPHIGTDKLPAVVKSLREEIEALGGRVLFESRLVHLEVIKNALVGVRYQNAQGEQNIDTQCLLLAIGHSAADTQQMLFEAGLCIKQKPFSVGFRIEHKQTFINAAQYGRFARHKRLPPAEYHLSARLRHGRGAYTFCMCPGGSVVGAASRAGGVCVNGMSPYLRDGENANAAVLVDVRQADFMDEHPMAGFAFQRALESKAFALGGGDYSAPAQLAADFLKRRPTKAFLSVKPTYLPGVTPCDLNALFPDPFLEALHEALVRLNGQLRGFMDNDAVLTAPETRSSCPVRIERDARCEANVMGVFPVGEGAGYAGGIMSAAVDGLKCAECALETIAPLE